MRRRRRRRTEQFPAEAMHAWIAGIKAGEFDDLS
jgi:hypothetical protein